MVLSSKSLPFSMLSDLFSFLSQLLILFLALELFAMRSQSTLGPLELAEVTISTMSPFWRVWSMVTILPLTLAPTHLHPMAECILKAKSSGVEPADSSMTSPFGVNTNTWLANRSIFIVSRKSFGSLMSCCHSRDWRSQASFISSLEFLPEVSPSLYFQCAAIPYSATSCISCVLICISNGSPLSPITVV